MANEERSVIEVRGLAKRFGEVQAVVGVDFDVQQGELFGFLGPNGAGKTTTINMLIGLARPDVGTIRIAGIDCSKDPKAAQHLMGIVPDESNLYPELPASRICAFAGRSTGWPSATAQPVRVSCSTASAWHRRLDGSSEVTPGA